MIPGQILEENENCTLPNVEVNEVCNQTIFELNERLMGSVRMFLLIEYSIIVLLLLGILVKYIQKTHFFRKRRRLSYIEDKKKNVALFHSVHIYLNWMLQFEIDSMQAKISASAWFYGSAIGFWGLNLFFGVLKEVLGSAGLSPLGNKRFNLLLQAGFVIPPLFTPIFLYFVLTESFTLLSLYTFIYVFYFCMVMILIPLMFPVLTVYIKNMLDLAEALEEHKISSQKNNPYRHNAEKIRIYKLTLQLSVPFFFFNFLLFVSPRFTKYEFIQLYGPIYVGLVHQPLIQIIGVYTKYILPGRKICYTESTESITPPRSMSI
eukprot:snap_masked-scaffold_3-processed-gene-10.22-mRNA-1 protein AED:1.00 eAED:1.00 QI:0/0/0/0/1/1/2/0/319